MERVRQRSSQEQSTGFDNEQVSSGTYRAEISGHGWSLAFCFAVKCGLQTSSDQTSPRRWTDWCKPEDRRVVLAELGRCACGDHSRWDRSRGSPPGLPSAPHPAEALLWVPTWLLPSCWPHRSLVLRWCGRRSRSLGRWSCPRCWWCLQSELGGPYSSAVPGECLQSPLPHRSFFSVHRYVALPALTSTPDSFTSGS